QQRAAHPTFSILRVDHSRSLKVPDLIRQALTNHRHLTIFKSAPEVGALRFIGFSSLGRRLGSCGRRSRLPGRTTAERWTRNLMKDYRAHAAGSGRPALTTV